MTRLSGEAPTCKAPAPKTISDRSVADTRVLRFRAARVFAADDAKWQRFVADVPSGLTAWARAAASTERGQ
eukprot:9659698-Alexandrium_andersonii.AAC.1